MEPLRLTPGEYEGLVTDPFAGERLATEPIHAVVVSGPPSELTDPGSLPVVVAWLGDELGGQGPTGADLVVSNDHALDRLTDVVAKHPKSSVALALLLRSQPSATVAGGLAAESSVYSMLQSGDEFGRWLDRRTSRFDDDEHGVTVWVNRDGPTLSIELNRPHRHNAISRRLRAELSEALALAAIDRTIESVELTGAGPSFCSGGDLGEFGSAPNPVDAHLTRLSQSPALLLHRIADRTTAYLHGSTMGGGLELAAFAGHVVADPATRFGLPEIDLGLIPGAGGTVSITRRIGRQRTVALALASETIDATTAAAWGLVDAIEPVTNAR